MTPMPKVALWIGTPLKDVPESKYPIAAAEICVSVTSVPVATPLGWGGTIAINSVSAATAPSRLTFIAISPPSLVRRMPLHVPLVDGVVRRLDRRCGCQLAAAPEPKLVLALVRLVDVPPPHRVLVSALVVGEAEPHLLLAGIDGEDRGHLSIEVQAIMVQVVEMALGRARNPGGTASVAAEVRLALVIRLDLSAAGHEAFVLLHVREAAAAGRAGAHRGDAAGRADGAEAGVGGLAHGVAGGRAGREVAEGEGPGAPAGRDRAGGAHRLGSAGEGEGEAAVPAGGVLGHHDLTAGVVGEAAVSLHPRAHRQGDRTRAARPQRRRRRRKNPGAAGRAREHEARVDDLAQGEGARGERAEGGAAGVVGRGDRRAHG